MLRSPLKLVGIFLLASFSSVYGSFAESGSKPAKEWSKSGFGGNVTYKCVADSCTKGSFIKVASFGGIGEVPELGIPSGSNLEAEFRRRPEVRRILAAMLQQLIREPRNKGKSLSSSYFVKQDHVGFNFVGTDSKSKDQMIAQLRISDNKAWFISSEAETIAIARRNFDALLPMIKTN